jgi:AGCS family alanine or glycine:cation symporter
MEAVQFLLDLLRTAVFFVRDTVWGFPSAMPILVVLLLGTGIFYTLRLSFIQVRQFRHALRVIRGVYDNPDDEGDITHFQALSAALSATVGIGNIAGVAIAIHYGGPGSLFWMWLTAIFGMTLKYVECTLAHHFRTINPDGSASGGPMYYIEKGLGPGWRWLAVCFAILAVICSFGTGNAIQAFTMADSLKADFLIPTWVTGLCSALLVGMVILGGIRRIGAVTSRLAPFMAAVYTAGGLLILINRYDQLPAAFWEIISGAFNPPAQVGGFAGSVFMFTLVWGVKRGLFSNEAGQGSAPIAHAAAKTKEPVREGIVALIEPFVDTLVICSITGLVIVTTGVWKEKKEVTLRFTAEEEIVFVHQGSRVLTTGELAEESKFSGRAEVDNGIPQGLSLVKSHSLMEDAVLLHHGELFTGFLLVPEPEGRPQFFDDRDRPVEGVRLQGRAMLNSSPLTAWGFQRGLSFLFEGGNFIVTFGVFLFAISTAISWSYYGDRSIEYLLGRRAIVPYRVAFVVMHFIGAILSLEVVWAFGDAALGLMALPNLIAILALRKVIFRLTRSYESTEHKIFR